MTILISQADRIIKLIEVLTISAVKFLIAPLYSLQIGYTYLQTILYTTIGGILGIFFFFYLSGAFIKLYKKLIIAVKFYYSQQDANLSNINSYKGKDKKTKKVFTWKNRILSRVRNKYGYTGIIILTPVFFSIPLGSFLAKKYYSEKKNVLVHLALSVFAWTFVLSTFFALL